MLCSLLFLLLLSCSHLISGAKNSGEKKGKKGKKTKSGGRMGKAGLDKARRGAEKAKQGAKVTKRGAKMTAKGAKKGAKVGRKGTKGVAKGIGAGILAAKEAKRGLSRVSRDSSSSADLDWKNRTQTELEEQPEYPQIHELPLPPIDTSYARPKLAKRSRHMNDQLRKDWRYLIDERGEFRFKSGRFGAVFLLPVGFPPAD